MSAPLGPAGCLPHKAALPSPGGVADHKRREAAKVTEKKKCVLNERTGQESRKRNNETVASSLPNTVQNTDDKNVQGTLGRTGELNANLREEPETVRKNQSETR